MFYKKIIVIVVVFVLVAAIAGGIFLFGDGSQGSLPTVMRIPSQKAHRILRNLLLSFSKWTSLVSPLPRKSLL